MEQAQVIQNFRNRLERMKGKKEELSRRLSDEEQEERRLTILQGKLEEVQTIIRTVSLQTQQELQYQLSSVVTAALEAVFDEPYEFQLEFVERRGQTDADIYFTQDGDRIDPMTGSGGGAVDTAAFSFRCALRQLRPKESRNFLALDEPFRFLSQNLQPAAAEMLEEICQKLNLQILMVTHNPILAESADVTYFVSKKRGRSKVSGGEGKGEWLRKYICPK